MSNTKPIDLAEKMTPFTRRRRPVEFNGRPLRVIRVAAGGTCPVEPSQVAFFHVIRGALVLYLPDETLTLRCGEMYVVPAGTLCEAIAQACTEVMVIDRTFHSARLH